MFDVGLSSPFDGMGLDGAEWWAAQESQKQQRERLLDRHIDRRWQALGEQSRRRLGVIAASTGVSTGVFEHGELVGAMGLIAEAEGVLEEEAAFAEDYLCVPWVCEAVAEWERERAAMAVLSPDERKERRREQTRLAVAKHRAKHRAIESARDAKKREGHERRMEAARFQRAIAIDGEGVTLDDGSHLYRYLAASLSDGTVLGELYEEDGILTSQALTFIANLPKYDDDGAPFLGVFGYGLGYDLTKMLERLKNKPLFELFHADDLKPKAKVSSYSLVLLGKCLQVTDKEAPKGQKKTLVWDILKGFQSTFVKALISWEVGTKEEWDRIEAMKKQRGNFVSSDWTEVTGYCKDECRLLAALTEKYIRAHVEAGIDLRGKYHGAGSTSDAFLTLMGAMEKRCTREVRSKDLEAFQAARSAFSRAFFGGRAEVSRLGVVRGPVWQADIASAYPHALFDLPCVKHGKWRLVRRKGLGRALRAARLACVHHRVEMGAQFYAEDRTRPRRSGELVVPEAPVVLGPVRRRKKKELTELTELEKTPGERAMMMGVLGDTSSMPWGPLPYRTEGGSIVFPAAHPGGWAWLPEYLVAKEHFRGAEAMEAWVLTGDCQCDRPYRAIGQYYLQRLEWGKEGRGKVLKLGTNGCYGKFAQVIGKNPKYSCRVVAGQITATTRSRLVEAIMEGTDDAWNVFYAATDGLLSTAEFRPPDPPENETVAGSKAKGKGWLGSWEVDSYSDDVFIVQPGFYFGMKKRDKGDKARTRGTPLEIIDNYRDEIIRQWYERPTKKPTGLPQQDVFHGIKTSIRPPTLKDPKYRRKPSYGRWSKEDRKINYVVSPKRSDLLDLGDGSYRLLGWWLSPWERESAEYKKDPSFTEMQAHKDDQPDFVEPLLQGVGKDD